MDLIDTIEVVFNEDVVPASVNNENVVITCAEEPLSAAVTYQAEVSVLKRDRESLHSCGFQPGLLCGWKS